MVLRGGTFSGVTLEPTLTRDGGILIHDVGEHHHFVTYAGPWAEARVQWPAALSIDSVNAKGRSFIQEVEDALWSNESDLRDYAPDLDFFPSDHLIAALSGEEPQPVIPGPHDQAWFGELERCWPVMQFVASELLSGALPTREIVARMLGTA